MERDRLRLFSIILMTISTHTLTWSVTLIVMNWFWFVMISTHTLTWSVTLAVVG